MSCRIGPSPVVVAGAQQLQSICDQLEILPLDCSRVWRIECTGNKKVDGTQPPNDVLSNEGRLCCNLRLTVQGQF
ncbi:hypothetical protein OUZ56_020303 [Daphnia magna]|uniref:Uncharacterized protein n=1 Tax=Daphnia magna TaxID=35525 RepID=A0ABQ9ZE47_9CRUS|nr:hypothetical protein OUZ56_020303 [Daphnia magna]